MINDIFRFCNIKAFSSNNVIDNIRIKTYTRMESFICIKE